MTVSLLQFRSLSHCEKDSTRMSEASVCFYKCMQACVFVCVCLCLRERKCICMCACEYVRVFKDLICLALVCTWLNVFIVCVCVCVW